MEMPVSHALVSNNLPIPAAIGSIDAYVGAVHQIPVLSLDEEQELARRFRLSEDLDAAKHLVLSHLRFVVHVARGYNGYGLQLADLIQEGNIGLMKAVKRFDPDQGVRLVSFAVHWIRAEMHEFILRNWRIVKVATTKAQRKLFFNLRKSKTRLGWMNARRSADRSPRTERARERGAGDGGAPVRPRHRLRCPGRPGRRARTAAPMQYLEAHSADPSLAYEHEDDESNQLELLREGLARLDERSRDIIKRRWLDADSKITLQDLADEYGVSAERIRQIEANAMKKMKALFAA
jgi:RNA polymerase sigma-32 factor